MIEEKYDWIVLDWPTVKRLEALNLETTKLCGSERSAWEHGREKKKGDARRQAITKRCVIRQGIRGRCNKEYRGQERSCITGYISFAHSSHPWSEPLLKELHTNRRPLGLSRKRGAGRHEHQSHGGGSKSFTSCRCRSMQPKIVPSLRHRSNDVRVTAIPLNSNAKAGNRPLRMCLCTLLFYVHKFCHQKK